MQAFFSLALSFFADNPSTRVNSSVMISRKTDLAKNFNFLLRLELLTLPSFHFLTVFDVKIYEATLENLKDVSKLLVTRARILNNRRTTSLGMKQF